jgi:hypothetical protein
MLEHRALSAISFSSTFVVSWSYSTPAAKACAGGELRERRADFRQYGMGRYFADASDFCQTLDQGLLAGHQVTKLLV